MKTKLILALVASIAALVPDLRAAEPKKVIVCTVTTGFRHSSIADAEKTLKQLGADSGAFTVVDFSQQPTAQIFKKPGKPGKPGDLKPDADEKVRVKYEADVKRYNDELKKYDEAIAKWTSADDEKAKASQAEFDAQMKASMAKLSPANLAANKIDGVIFANTTGDLPLPDREGFIKWIEAGHGFMAVHSGSDTFHGFKGYTEMLQGQFETHGSQVPADLIAADAAHPANGGVGAKWDIAQEEMYLIKSQDRAKVRSLWYLSHHPNDTAKAGFFPVAWCRKAGDDGARVLRELQQSAGKAVVGRAVFVAEHAGDQPHHSIRDDRSGERAVGEDVIADADFLIDEVVDDALIDAFVMTAEENEMRKARVFLGDLLGERAAAGRHENHAGIRGAEFLDRGEKWLALHHHSLAPAVRRVVGCAVFVIRPLSQIMHAEIDKAALLRLADHARAERRGGDFGKDREDVEAHGKKVIGER